MKPIQEQIDAAKDWIENTTWANSYGDNRDGDLQAIMDADIPLEHAILTHLQEHKDELRALVEAVSELDILDEFDNSLAWLKKLYEMMEG